MRQLFLFTIDYTSDKMFIEPELHYLIENFDVVLVLEQEPKDDILINGKHVKYIVYKKKRSLIDYFYYFIFLFNIDLLIEVWEIIKDKEFRISRIKNSLSFYFVSRELNNFYQKEKILYKYTSAIYYTYWSIQSTLALTLYSHKYPNIKVITRVHGYDLYNERNLYGRLPFRHQIDKRIDRIIFASQYGLDYYLKTYEKQASEKYILSRLGIENDFGIGPYKKDKNFVLVSCSNLIEIKRVDLIVKGLSMIDNFMIYWIHFGDGDQYSAINLLSENLLREKKNIEYYLAGQIGNEEIHHFYKNESVDCFITTSSTEGGNPVSIQEAMSYGIPIIGTRSGGIPEMINGNGFVLPSNPTALKVSEAIRKIYEMNDEVVNCLRKRSRENWEKNFTAKHNHSHLITILKNLNY